MVKQANKYICEAWPNKAYVWETLHLLMFKLETVACCLTTTDIFISATWTDPTEKEEADLDINWLR